MLTFFLIHSCFSHLQFCLSSLSSVCFVVISTSKTFLLLILLLFWYANTNARTRDKNMCLFILWKVKFLCMESFQLESLRTFTLRRGHFLFIYPAHQVFSVNFMWKRIKLFLYESTFKYSFCKLYCIKNILSVYQKIN